MTDRDIVVTLLQACEYTYRERKSLGKHLVPTKWTGLIEADVHDGELFFYFVDGDLTDITREGRTIIPGFEKAA